MFDAGVVIRLELTRDEPQQFRYEYELLYLLEGVLEVTCQGKAVRMKRGDILLINGMESYSTAAAGEGRICRFLIDGSVFDEILGEGRHVFDCDSGSASPGTERYNRILVLRRLLNEFLRGYLQNGSRIGYAQFAAYLQLVEHIAKSFRLEAGAESMSRKDRSEERIRDVILYVQQNYNRQITLSDLAKRFYVTDSHLSRVLKKALGISYRDYVNKVRMQHAVNDLMYSDSSIIRVANDNGFSSLAVFNKVFKETYGMVPSQYRREMRAVAEREREQQKELERRTIEEMERYFEGEHRRGGSPKAAARPAEQVVDALRCRTYDRVWQEMISVGTASDLLNPKIQEHIALLKEQLDFRYVRFWGVFHDEMMVFPDRSLSGLNFNRVDDAISFLLEHRIKPFLQLGPKPRTLIGSVGRGQVSTQRDSVVISDLDAPQWGALLDRLMKHLIRRFGAQEVESWIFEMWCPCHWDGEWFRWYSEEKYVILYRTVKKYVPGALVGGCEFVFDEQTKRMEETLAYWRLRKAMPDFLSYTAFPYGGWKREGSPWITDPDHLLKVVGDIRREMQVYGLDTQKLFITSWNLSISNRNLLNDSVFKGAYIVKNAVDMIGEADLLSYWLASDAYAEHYDSQAILFGGAGLISKDGMRKPAMYAYLFLRRLQERLVAKGENYIVTRNLHDSYTILYHNFKPLNYSVYLKPESEISYHELDGFLVDEEPLDLLIRMTNVKDGLYDVRRQTLHRDSGSVLDEWHRIGGFVELHKEDMVYLGQISIPRINISRQTTVDGCLEFAISAGPNEFGVIEVLPVIRE